MDQNNDICENIVGHANQIWDSISNFSGNTTQGNQNSGFSQNTFALILLAIIAIYLVLSYVQPRRSSEQSKPYKDE